MSDQAQFQVLRDWTRRFSSREDALTQAILPDTLKARVRQMRV